LVLNLTNGRRNMIRVLNVWSQHRRSAEHGSNQ
jgi:hypothetical protein